MEAGIGVMQLQAEKCQRLSAHTRSQKKQISFRGSMALPTPGFQTSELEENELLFKATQVLEGVTAALGD